MRGRLALVRSFRIQEDILHTIDCVITNINGRHLFLTKTAISSLFFFFQIWTYTTFKIKD